MSYYIASCSCGKDSLAMVYLLIEKNYPLDEIVFFDTGMEFDATYKNWEKLKLYVEQFGIKHTKLSPKTTFLYDMLERPKQKKTGEVVKGNDWCGGACRWGTFIKQSVLNRYCGRKNVVVYIGFCKDEPTRLENLEKHKKAPLAEWGMTEEDCLAYCRKKGITWEEEYASTPSGKIDLYDILDRVSCWCCANKNQWELYNIWRYLPLYWDRLTELQEKILRPFKKGYTLFDLEERFIDGYIPKHRKKPRRKV